MANYHIFSLILKIMMEVFITGGLRKYKSQLNQSLFKNTAFIFSSRILTAVTGLVFWNIAARYYSPEEVGMATAVISTISLVVIFSRFGIDISLIRFMHLKDKDIVFNTCILITSLSSVILALICITMIDLLSPALLIIKEYAPTFILFSLLGSITMTSGNAFLSLKSGNYYLIQNIINSIRVPALILFAFLGSMGIIYSMGIADLFSAIFALIFIRKLVNLKFQFNNSFLREISRFSFFTYISDIFYEIPILILPIMILNFLGAENTAEYFVSFMLGSMLMLISDVVARSLLITVSHGEILKKNFFLALITIYSILTPAIIAIYFCSEFILNLFGKTYVSAHDLFIIYAISCLFIAIIHIFNVTLSIKMMAERRAIINGFRFLLIISLSYILMANNGLIGLGYAWLVSHAIVSLLMVILATKQDWIS